MKDPERGATFDPSMRYRYVLWRHFVPQPTNVCLWILLNPSTATELEDDPTVRKCQAFTRRWGHDACRIVNVFAWRSTDPRVLATLEDPIGPENDRHILTEAASAQRIVCAWGHQGRLRGRGARVRELLRISQRESWCLGQTLSGEPVHPLYRPSDQPLVRFA